MASSISGIASYYENWASYSYSFQDGILFTTLNTTSARNILTTVFVVLNFAVGFVGAFYLQRRNLHRLNTGDRKVPINHLASWMSLSGTLTYTWNTFQLPGGYYGLLMLLTGVFGLAHQYFVNSFILPISIQSTCRFEFGIVTTQLPKGDNSIIPSSTFSSATTVYNAQYGVWANGGEMGIYQKVNYTSVTFTPTADDVLGGWNCSYEPTTTIAWTDWANQTAFSSFIKEDSFLYPEVIIWAGAVSANGSTGKGFMVWSADQPDDSSEQWNLRALVATNLTGSTAPVTNLECQLVAGAGWTPPIMPSNRSLTEWAPRTFGFLTGTDPDYYGFYMEWILNGMVMLTGSGNYDRWDSSVLPAGASDYYGCTGQLTQISPEIWAILGVGLLMLVALLVVDLFFALFHFFQQKHSHNGVLAESAPSSIQEWQLALLREVTNDKTIKATQMQHYSYGWDSAREKYVFDDDKVFQGKTFSPAI
jgi:hypothetical protein